MRRIRVTLRLVLAGALLTAGVLLPALGHGGVQAASLGSAGSASADSGSTWSWPIQQLGSSTPSTGTGRIVVRLVAGVAPDFSSLGLREIDSVPGLNLHVLSLVDAGSLGLAEAEARIVADVQIMRMTPGVVWAEEDGRVESSRIPNDPSYHDQWGPPQVGLPAAWDVTTGSAEVTIAVLDTGIDGNIPDFSGRIVSPHNVVNDSSDSSSWADTEGHGSGVAGVAAAAGDDGQGIAGAAWNVKIMPIKITESDLAYDSTLAAGITYAVDHGADVINVSFTGGVDTRVQRDAVDYALTHNVIMVASAGNHSSAGVEYPAAYPGVISVGAVDQMDARSSYSAYGAGLDLVAPGDGILSWAIADGVSHLGLWSGTSFAAPLVAGVVALMRSVDTDLTPSQAADILEQTAKDLGPAGWDRDFGYGLIDAGAAVRTAFEAASTTTTSSTSTTLSTTTTTTPVQPFSDVGPTTQYVSQINDLASRGLVTGMGDGTFRPGQSLTRQQFAKMIVLTMRYPVSGADSSPFTDVRDVVGNLYPYHYVAVAWKNGVTQGTNPIHYSPFANISRAQVITMVARAAELAEPPDWFVPTFGNFSADHYPYARKAAYAGLLDGLSGLGSRGYDFWTPATRGEACVLLYDLLHR